MSYLIPNEDIYPEPIAVKAGPASASHRSVEYWEKMLAKVSELLILQHQSQENLELLRYTLELRRELAIVGHTMEEAHSVIRRDQTEEWRKHAPTSKHFIPGAHIMGCILKDGKKVWFTKPVRPL